MKDAGFTHNNIDFSVLSNICDLNAIAKDEIVSVKGKIVSISATKKVAFRKESSEKREAMIADPTENIQVVIWVDLCKTEARNFIASVKYIVFLFLFAYLFLFAVVDNTC